MKTTIELPDELLKLAKAKATLSGMSLKNYFREALENKLAQENTNQSISKPWMKGFGGLSHLHKETKRIEKIIQKEFESIQHEEWK